MAKTRKTITISIKESLWTELKDKKIRVSTIINKLLENYLNEENNNND